MGEGKRVARAKIAFFALRDEKNRRFVSLGGAANVDIPAEAFTVMLKRD